MNRENKMEGGPSFGTFASAAYAFIRQTTFHRTYYRILERFARGDIRKLIISVPPQHGKSVGASVLLPAYMLGLNPDLKIALASYSTSLASRFNRRVQRVMDSEEYAAFFPQTTIKPPGSGAKGYARTATNTEVVGCGGELLAVGREGPLTGHTVDVFILDDLYKDAMEANSPVIRENCLEWYTSVVKTRLHNDSQELIVFTRWHEHDLIGTILANEKHTMLTEWGQIGRLPKNRWLVVNFDALKEGPPTAIDHRAEGEPLWAAKHNRKHLLERRMFDKHRFECLYQGRPSQKNSRLYGDKLQTYTRIDERTVRNANYTDTADLGDDYLCSVCYRVGASGRIYVTDVVYTSEPMEVTEKLVADMLMRNDTRVAYVESNNGGRGFARSVGALARHVRMEWFNQTGNKEARILTNSATVLQNILLPEDWAQRWPEFNLHVTTYLRKFSANRLHDAPDVLTGIVEKEIDRMRSKRIAVSF